MIKLHGRDKIMLYGVDDYCRLAVEYESLIRTPANRRLQPGEQPLPPFPSQRIYQHINYHLKNRHARLEHVLHRLYDAVDEVFDNELVQEHRTKRRRDGRPIKRLHRDGTEKLNKLVTHVKHLNQYLDSIPDDRRLEALLASSVARSGYTTTRLADEHALAEREEGVRRAMLGTTTTTTTTTAGHEPATKRPRHQ
jgi:hypothetical protein